MNQTGSIQRMKKIGITGTIAAGKTTVSILLRRKGYHVFDSDGYSHILYRKTDPCYQKVVDAFGEEILDATGEIDRKKLADRIFSDEAQRKMLNGIVHSAVREGMERFFANHTEEALVFAEVPLLFEAHMQDCFDEILVVTCEKETAIRRMMEDRDYSRTEAEARYAAAMKSFVNQDNVIFLENDHGLKELNERVNSYLLAAEEGNDS